MEPIVNRVANSSLLTIDLGDYLKEVKTSEFDIAQALEQGFLLREKAFRQFIKEYDWESFQGHLVRVHCSTDAIIPAWAYMLVATKLATNAAWSYMGSEAQLEHQKIDLAIKLLLTSQSFDGAKVVIKGCGEIADRDYAYYRLSQELVGLVSSIMYGEPCSTVPVYKKPRN